jgi:curved DNA-binding protein CbpA
MGNQASVVDPVHARIYHNMIQIQDPQKRIQMIQTCMASMEYVNSAKRGGIYSYLLHYISSVQSGANPPLLPGEQNLSHSYSNAHAMQPTQAIPRSMQPMPSHSGPGATHPSMLHAPTASTYQQPQTQYSQPQYQQQQLAKHVDNTPSWKIVTETPKQKAISYFASCLEVLGIQEEVALTEEALKSAYKKTALRAHPDKGGSEEYFEAVTRSYAYLSEILKFMKGGRKEVNGHVEAPSNVRNSRDTEAKQWEMPAEPVRLNAKNLDMNAFNKLFEQTHMPDPDSDGYGDWLKSADSKKAGPAFKGEFNRDVFNRMFDEETKKGRQPSNHLIVHPGEMALTLNPTHGVDLVGERPDSYTAAPNSKFQFTDLRGAYTSESTISDKVANVPVQDRNYEQYRASREKAPDPFTSSEMNGIREFEQRQSQLDQMRERKRAEMHVRNQQYSDRLKQMVITDGVDLNQKKLTY